MADTSPPSLPADVSRLLRRRPLRLGTRASPLAMAQAHETCNLLAQCWNLSPEAIEIHSLKASGDKIQDRPLREIGGKALWTKELDRALATGDIDFAVHSMKDVETFRPDALVIAAMLERADPRDRLVGASSIGALPERARLGTSSPRRAAQALHLRPDLEIVMFRGNVATRLRRIDQGEAEATLLAAAGLDRLGLSDIGHPLDPTSWIPAASQGAIGIETRADNDAMRGLLAAISHPDTYTAVMAERATLAALTGDCSSPIAVHALVMGEEIVIHAAIFTEDGAEASFAERRFETGDAKGPAVLAADLLDSATPRLREQFANASPAGIP